MILDDIDGACALAKMRVHRSIGQHVRAANEVIRADFKELRLTTDYRFALMVRPRNVFDAFRIIAMSPFVRERIAQAKRNYRYDEEKQQWIRRTARR